MEMNEHVFNASKVDMHECILYESPIYGRLYSLLKDFYLEEKEKYKGEWEDFHKELENIKSNGR